MMKELLNSKCERVIKWAGWNINHYTDDGRVVVETFTPDGEYYSICVDVENFPDAVAECYRLFDPDKYVDMWVQAKYIHLVSRVPVVFDIIRDAWSIKQMLWNLAAPLVPYDYDIEPPEPMDIVKESKKGVVYMKLGSQLIHDFIDKCHWEIDEGGSFRRVKNAVAVA